MREADRVAHRRTDWFRDWVDHPKRGGFWDDITPPLPDAPPDEDVLDRIEDRFDGGLFHAVRDDAPRCVDGSPCESDADCGLDGVCYLLGNEGEFAVD